MLKKGLNQLLGNGEDSRDAAREDSTCLKRRGFLKLVATTAGGVVAAPALARLPSAKERTLAMYNPHTGESLRTVYWAPDTGYIEEALKDIDWVMRDRRNDEVMDIDRNLLDLLHIVRSRLGTREPLHVISGYRSPETNAMLRRSSSKVAKRSYHMAGQAVDIQVPGRAVKDVRKVALELKAGGVGYYPRSGFVHLDTGSFRTWWG